MRSRTMLKSIAVAALLALVAGTVHAQDAKAPAEKTAEKSAASGKLSVGDKAPAIEVEKFLKGTPVTGYEKGKTYVVEFWATWCGPCVQSMPHISHVQKEFKDKGLTIIGVNVWEDDKYNAETLKNVETFVAEMGDKMAYTVAYDGAAKKMDEGFMKAAGRRGIPSCFVVDGESKVAWVGHPMWLDTVLPDVISGKYEANALTEKVKAGEKAQKAVFEKMQSDPAAAITAWEAFEKDYPGPGKIMESIKYTLYMQAEQFDKLFAFMGKQADEAITSKDTMKLNEIAWMLVDPESQIEKPDLALALKAAEKANEFSKSEDPAILDTLARVYWVKGDKAKAAEMQAKAVELANKTEKYKPMAAELEERLKQYKGGK